MAKLLPIIMLLIGIGGGIGAGIMLAPAPEESEVAAAGEGHDASQEESAEEHAEEDAAEDENAEPNEFIKINNQFVIPVVERDQMTAMVVLSLSLETKPGMSGKVHSFEPKLRDVFLRVLFDHANMGASVAHSPALKSWIRFEPLFVKRHGVSLAVTWLMS